MVDVDPRLAARRRQVAEVHARSSLSRVLTVLAVLALAGAGVWLLRSPLLSIHQIRVSGIESGMVVQLLAREGVGEGRPLISVPTGRLEQVLRANPRIKGAEVRRQWPQTLVVTIEERVPVAWAPFAGGWARVGIDGVVIATAPAPDSDLPRLEIAEVGASPSAAALGALAFLQELAPQPGLEVVVTSEGNDLWALVNNVMVRLGRPVDMEIKARVLRELLAGELVPGSTVNLVAPTRPAVLPPEGEEG
jgi:cell division protein FtsQ